MFHTNIIADMLWGTNAKTCKSFLLKKDFQEQSYQTRISWNKFEHGIPSSFAHQYPLGRFEIQGRIQDF